MSQTSLNSKNLRPPRTQEQHDAVKASLDVITALLIPLLEARFRDRMIAILMQPVDFSSVDPEGWGNLIKLGHMYQRFEHDPTQPAKLDQAFHGGEQALQALMDQMPPDQLQGQMAKLREAVEHPPMPGDEELREYFVEHAYRISRDWINTLIDDRRATKTVEVDECMLPIQPVPLDPYEERILGPIRWPQSRHPNFRCSDFIIQADEMREMFRQLKAQEAPNQSLLKPALDILETFGITAVQAPSP